MILIEYVSCTECDFSNKDLTLTICPHCGSSVKLEYKQEAENIADSISLFCISFFGWISRIVNVIIFFIVIILFLRSCNGCDSAVSNGGIKEYLNYIIGTEVIK